MKINNIREGEGLGILKNFDDVINKIDDNVDYTVIQVAKLVGLSTTAVMNHIKRDKLKARFIFSRRYVKGKDLKDFLVGVMN